MGLAEEVTMEAGRLQNLSSGFGWEKVKEELNGRMLQITLSKEMVSQAAQDGDIPE